jgi:hypothetical protein
MFFRKELSSAAERGRGGVVSASGFVLTGA